MNHRNLKKNKEKIISPRLETEIEKKKDNNNSNNNKKNIARSILFQLVNRYRVKRMLQC